MMRHVVEQHLIVNRYTISYLLFNLIEFATFFLKEVYISQSIKRGFGVLKASHPQTKPSNKHTPTNSFFEKMNNMRMGATILALMVFLAISAAAEVDIVYEISGNQQPLNDILVASTLFPQVVDNNQLSCIPNGQVCQSSSECCPHSRCAFGYILMMPVSKCEWCPGVGDTCGVLDSCCPGLECKGSWFSQIFSGTCS